MTVLSPITKFPEVHQADASGELGRVYDDIELALRAPWVPFASQPPPDPRPKLRAAGRSDEEISKIGRALDPLNYCNPKGLILITAWNEAWNDRAAGSPANSLSAAEVRQDGTVLES